MSVSHVCVKCSNCGADVNITTETVHYVVDGDISEVDALSMVVDCANCNCEIQIKE